MNKILIKFICIVITICTLVITNIYINKLQNENKLLHNNQEVFLDSIQKYKVADSLNAAKIDLLMLSNNELKKHISDDAKLIKKLKADKPETIIVTKTETKTEIVTELIDKDTLKQIKYKSKWTSVDGFIFGDSINLNIQNNEELVLVESKQKKKLWFVKLPIWLFGYKTKDLNIVSKNPNTTIKNIEYIQIRK